MAVKPLVDRRAVERRVFETVAELLAETEHAAGRGTVTLHASLERDLGIGSLERVELLLRLERVFDVRLADSVMADAGTPADLVAAILTTAEPSLPATRPERRVALAAGAPAPAAADTLVEVLRWHARANPDRVHILLREEDGAERPITYGALWNGARALAAGLREDGLGRGETVALMLRTEEAFFQAFFGTLLSGGVPVPIYPPFRADRIEEYVRRQVGILTNAEARVLITFARAERVATLLRGQAPLVRVVTSVDRLVRSSQQAPLPDLSADDPALIQYTSGSTGGPKGVLLSHANLLANIRAIGEALTVGPDDVVVSWLPLYHDMGLIGAWLCSLYFGTPVTILSPLAFLSRPARWLWAIHANRGTISPAPNFAFDLCVRKVADEEIAGLDLSAWRLALNGSEPVSPETIERFIRRFQPYGFRPEAMCPVYGLAESSVGLTTSPLARVPRIERVDRTAFERLGIARPVTAGARAPLQFVSCGHPLPHHNVRVVESGGRRAADRVEGAVEFRGPSVTRGYFRNAEATRAVLRDGGWLDSGDLGYWADGELFITGRQKDLIIQAGRNIYPQEVEEVAGAVAGIRAGCVAVFGVPEPRIGTERLVIIAETRESTAARRDELRAAVLDHVVRTLGIVPDDIGISDPGTVPKTSSGKIRRGAAREAYLRGGFVPGRRRSVAAQWARLLTQDLSARLRRVAGTVGRIAFTGYVVSLLVLTLPLLWALLVLLPRGRPIHRLIASWSRGMFLASGCRLRVAGLERLRNAGPVVLAANHASYLDAVALLAALPVGFRFAAKRALGSYPVIGTVIRKAEYVSIEKADLAGRLAGAEHITAVLRTGVAVLIFPEGGFVREPGLRPFRLGAFKAAAEAGCAVVPIGLRGTRPILPDGTGLMRPGIVDVTIGAPVVPESTDWRAMVRLRDVVRTEIATMTGERASAS